FGAGYNDSHPIPHPRSRPLPPPTAADGHLHTLAHALRCGGAEAPPAVPSVGAVDHARVEAAVRELLAAVGEDPDREGLKDTPARVARMYAEIFSGLHSDPAQYLQKTFTQKHDEMVLVKDIEFSSCCEHHLLPFTGKAHVGYLPNGKVVGLSKLAR